MDRDVSHFLTGLKTPAKLRRWYDKDTGCIRLTALIREMPQSEIRETAAKLILTFADRITTQINTQLRGAPISIGFPALQDLYISKTHQRRWYDNDPLLRRSFGSFYTLPDYGLTAISFALMDTFELMLIYSFACTRLGTPPANKDMLDIIKVGIDKGKIGGGDQVLSDIIGKDLFETLTWEMQ